MKISACSAMFRGTIVSDWTDSVVMAWNLYRNTILSVIANVPGRIMSGK
jgi:hypothetical protein